MQTDYKTTRLEIAKLELKAGDILVVKIVGPMPSMFELDGLRTVLLEAVPQGAKWMVLRDNIELQVIDTEDYKEK